MTNHFQSIDDKKYKSNNKSQQVIYFWETILQMLDTNFHD